MDLDQWLADLNEAAQPGLDRLPLLQAVVFGEDAASQNAGHLLVGCMGQWLYKHDGLSVSRLEHLRGLPLLAASLSAVAFSQQVLNGTLLPEDVAPAMLDFSKRYVPSVFLRDFTDLNVFDAEKLVISEVVDDQRTMSATWAGIDTRYQDFLAGRADWANTQSHYQQIDLDASTRTESGWLQTFAVLNLLQPISEKQRCADLNVFWALMDCAPETDSHLVLAQLRALTGLDLGEGVDQTLGDAISALKLRLKHKRA